MATKLKVFTWSDGFHAFTIAASSRPKALEAWGVEQDLFKTGLAQEAPEGPDRVAALATPGAVITRGLTINVGETRAPRPKATDAKTKAKLRSLERELKALNEAHSAALAALDERQRELDRARDQHQSRHDKNRAALMAKLKTARAAAS